MNEDYTKLKDFAQKRLDDSCRNDDDYDIRYWIGYIDGLNALQKRMDGDMAIEALEKQIPKKPKRVDKNSVFDGNWKMICPCCGATLMKRITTECESRPIHYNMTKHCKCGQALDWSENND